MLMPIVTKALLEKRARLEARANDIGLDALQEECPEAAGYLRCREGERLFERRDDLMATLLEVVREQES